MTDNKAPPTLLEVSVHSLLRDESLAISAIKILPRELFPPLFKEALTSGRNDTVRAMVAAWPFPCLPVSFLMKTPNLKPLQAVLSGIDLLLTQVHPRKWKLQVVELGNVDCNFWNIWAGAHHPGCSTWMPPRKPGIQNPPICGDKQLLKVVADFHLENHHLDENHKLLLQWAKLRRGSVQLCCRKLQVSKHPVSRIQEILKVCEPDSIQELELNSRWKLETLTDFAPYLGKMRNLLSFHLLGIYKQRYAPKDEEMEGRYIFRFISQFSKLQSLQHLHMNAVYFLRNHLKQLFWSLKTPLETLSITFCSLSQADIDYLSHCPRLWQLTYLNLSGVFLLHSHARLLQGFLERVAGTLQSLVLEDCRMEESHLSALLPALSHCTQLTQVNFCGNNFSLSVLKTLLCHMASLSQLTLELYPAPLETYEEMHNINPERFSQLCSHLMDTLCALRQPRKVSFATDLCLKCNRRCFYSLEATLCHCWQFE